MRDAKISEIKNSLSRYLDLVRNGEIVRVLDRDTPIATIVPIDAASVGRHGAGEALRSMERKGLIRRGSGKIPRQILEKDPPGKPVGVLQALLEERDHR